MATTLRAESWWRPYRYITGYITELIHMSPRSNTSTQQNTTISPVDVVSRPFTARSVIASTLLGAHPPRLPGRVLVRSGAMFGIGEGTVRVALTRMVANGEIQTKGDGRYELIGHLRQRQTRQDQSRSGVQENAWNGDWELAVVDATEARTATDRAELRVALQRLRFGELREGVWLRPNNLDPDRLPEHRAVVDASVRRFVSQPVDAREMPQRLWDLVDWSNTAADLVESLRTHTTRLRSLRSAYSDLADAFTLNAAVLRHLQADPLLPTALLPRSWRGTKLRDQFEMFDSLFQQRWRLWLKE
jgi:phenylacetic acid degradation operon negative regulatory protein